MAMKSVTLITVLVVVLAATQAAKAQLVSITGTVPCSVNGSIAVNGTGITPPPFPNALVQLSCNGTVRGAAITNTTGGFNITVGLPPQLTTVNNILTSCRLVVATPLSACNSCLPSDGRLVAPLRPPLEFVGTIVDLFEFSNEVFQFLGVPTTR